MSLLETVKLIQDTQVGIVCEKNERQLLFNYFKDNQCYTENFQNPFFERLNVRENIKFYLKWYGSREDVDDVLNLFFIDGLKKHKMKQLNHDEYILMKLCIAYIQPLKTIVMCDVLHDLHIETIDKVRQLMTIFQSNGFRVIHLLGHIDHAILLSDNVYQVKHESFKRLEVTNDDEQPLSETESSSDPQEMQVSNIFKLSVKVDDKTLFLNPESIDYIEGYEGKVNIYLNNESWLADYSLTELEERLGPYGFYRCHRSYIVNLQKVKELITWSKNSYSIKLDSSNNNFVPLSRAKLKEFQKYFNGDTVQFTEK